MSGSERPVEKKRANTGEDTRARPFNLAKATDVATETPPSRKDTPQQAAQTLDTATRELLKFLEEVKQHRAGRDDLQLTEKVSDKADQSASRVELKSTIEKQVRVGQNDDESLQRILVATEKLREMAGQLKDVLEREKQEYVLSPKEREMTAKFYELLSEGNRRHPDMAVINVNHILPGRDIFFQACDKAGDLVALVPKGTSLDNLHYLPEGRFPIEKWGRSGCENPDFIVNAVRESLEPQHKRLVLMDHGGYFAQTLDVLKDGLAADGVKLIGVIEATENGHQRYEQRQQQGDLSVPVISVARSDLKEAEDRKVGESIVFSTDAILRQNGELLSQKQAVVIGYGKIGSSIADYLGARTIVVEKNPLKRMEAQAHGFRVTDDLNKALEKADVVFSATGRQALRDRYDDLKTGSTVVTVTSADDELGKLPSEKTYDHRTSGPFMHKYTDKQQQESRTEGGAHYFYLMHEGRTINFVHAAVVGPYIEAVLGEEYAALHKIAKGGASKGLQEMSPKEQRDIAEKWFKAFADDNQL